MRRFTWFNATSIALGFAFLYVPILLLVIYSFNESKLVTVWGGWSTKWYASLLENEGILNAAWVTLRVAIVSSTLATVLGTLAAIVLVRMGRFPGRTLFSGMIYAPLVMPDVITGLSLLLLFVALGLARGFWTIVLAHITFSMCYIAIVVQSRLSTFDRSLEEAAQDLGCPPFKTFMVITLPIILPGIISGMIFAFVVSFDDVVMALFLADAQQWTLPRQMWSGLRENVDPTILAAGTLLSIFSIVVQLVADALRSGKRFKRGRRSQ